MSVETDVLRVLQEAHVHEHEAGPGAMTFERPEVAQPVEVRDIHGVTDRDGLGRPLTGPQPIVFPVRRLIVHSPLARAGWQSLRGISVEAVRGEGLLSSCAKGRRRAPVVNDRGRGRSTCGEKKGREGDTNGASHTSCIVRAEPRLYPERYRQARMPYSVARGW